MNDLRKEPKKKRLKTWYKHFQNLLGKPPKIVEENEVIIQVIPTLSIKREAFEMYEYIYIYIYTYK